MNKNQKLADYTISPVESFQWIENAFFQHLQRVKFNLRDEMKKFRNKYKAIFEKNKEQVLHLIKNEFDKGNVYFTLIAVSAYEVFLQSGMAKSEALMLTEECLTMPAGKYFVESTQQLLDNSPDPFEALVKVSKEREQNYFGNSFEFDRPVDNEYGYILHVKKCLFHLVLAALNRTELQHILCSMDLGWINGIKPGKHHLQFVRPVTFASGNTCQMWFIKMEKEEAGHKAESQNQTTVRVF